MTWRFKGSLRRAGQASTGGRHGSGSWGHWGEGRMSWRGLHRDGRSVGAMGRGFPCLRTRMTEGAARQWRRGRPPSCAVGGRPARGEWVPVSTHENDGGGGTSRTVGWPSRWGRHESDGGVAFMRGGRSIREGAWVPVSTHENDGGGGTSRTVGVPSFAVGGRFARGAWVPVSTHENDGGGVRERRWGATVSRGPEREHWGRAGSSQAPTGPT